MPVTASVATGDLMAGPVEVRIVTMRQFARPDRLASLSAEELRSLVAAARDAEREARLLCATFETAEYQARTGEPF